MTGNELKLETRRPDEALSGRADFYVVGNRQTLGWLKSTLDYALSNPGVSVMTSASRNDGSTLCVRVVNDEVNV